MISEEGTMKIRRQISANARRKLCKVQHDKVKSRRQFYFNQMVAQESSEQLKTH